MPTNSTFNTIQALAETISSAEVPRAAAGATAAWFKRRAMIGLLDSLTASLDIVLSPGYKPGETAVRWMQSPETWLMWQAWEEPRRLGENVLIPECAGKALLIPLRYEGTLYGLLWLKTSRKYEEAQAILLANVLAARLHHLAVNSRWDTLLVSVNAFSRALSQEVSSEELWQTVHRQISDLFDTSSFYVGLLNSYTSQLTLPLYSENEVQIYYGPIRLSGLSRAVVQHGTPLLFHNVAAEKERLDALNVTFDEDEPGRHAASWLGVPMRNRRGEVIGIVSIQNVLPNCYADPDLHLLMLVAGHIAHTVESKRLLQDEQERRRVASTLMEIGQVVNSSLDQEEILERILEQIQHVVAYDSASILLPIEDDHDGSRMVVAALNGLYPAAKGAELHLDTISPGALVLQSQQPLVISDVQAYVGWNDSLPTGPRARSWLGVPMRIQNRVIGLITLDKSTPHYYNENDATTVFAMARQAAIAVENARLLVQSEAQRQSLEQRARRLDSMQRIATIISSSLEHDAVLNMAAKFLTDLFEVDHCGIVLIHPADGSASLVAEHPSTGNIGIKIPTQGNPVFEKMVQDNRPIAIHDAEDFDEIDDETRGTVQRVGARSALLAPLIARNQFIGSIGLDMTTQKRVFTQEERETLMTIAAQVALAINNAQLYEEAVAVSYLKNELLSNMSHELRTPLNAIIGYSEMLLSEVYGKLNPKQIDRLARVHSGGKHLLALINNVLDLSKIESGQMKLAFEPTSAAEIIHDVVADFAPKAQAKGLTFELKLADNLPSLRADSVRVRQILSGLVDNAIKFTDSGGVTIQAAVAVSSSGKLKPETLPPPNNPLPDGNWLAITVHDTGIGIQPEDQKVIFDAFRQIDGSSIRKYEGTGLGLTLVKQLVNLHQGCISVESAPGQGSTFMVLLPLLADIHSSEPLGDAETERPTVLVIDDDPAAVQLVYDLLSRDIYHVVGTTNPSQALELARKLHPAAVITDIMMPVVNGWEILRSLKADQETQDIPVIILSVIEQKTVGFYLGASDYLLKPINRQSLFDALERTARIEPKDPILVVDDNADDRMFLADLLKRANYPVEQLASGEAALDWLENHPASLILLDLMLPGLSGLELLERLRHNPATAGIPVVIITGADVAGDKLANLQAPVLQKGGMSGNSLVKEVQFAINRSLRQRLPKAR